MNLEDIVENVDRRLTQLDAEIDQLQSARAALLNGSHTEPRAVRPQRSPRATEKRSYVVVPVGKLTGLLGASDGLRTRELAQSTNGDPALILELLKEQESAGNIRRSGARAATRWHLVTDEDRIAARAAELQLHHNRGRARKS